MKRMERLEVFPTENRQWGWRCVAGNGRTIFTARETFTREEDAATAVKGALGAVSRLVLNLPVRIMTRQPTGKSLATSIWPDDRYA
jgi:uncharacterized protein YegP (UPF0339 family)